MANNTKKGEVKFNYLQVFGYLAIIVIIIAIFNLGMRLTGYTLNVGAVNVTVETSSSVNFSTDTINFGSGQVLTGANVTLISNKSGAPSGGNWTQPNANLVLENIGNVNVSLNLLAGKSASTLIGGSNPEYQYNVNNAELDSCALPNVTFGTYYDVNTSSPGTLICTKLYKQNTNDTLNITIRLVIPSDSKTGSLGDTLTITATTTST